MENSEAQALAILETIDLHTRMRAASLSAKGLLDNQIADILLLTMEQMGAVKTSQEFRIKYAEEANAAIEKQISLEEGWDTLEEDALANLIETMRFNRDPKFTLQVAAIANRAERRVRTKQEAPKVVDATKTTNNVVILQMNRNYIKSAGDERTLDITPRPTQIPLKQSDVPAPKLVDQMLAPAKERASISATDTQMTDLEKMAESMGVVFDKG